MKMRATFTFDPEQVSIKEVRGALTLLAISEVEFNMSKEKEAKPVKIKDLKLGGTTL